MFEELAFVDVGVERKMVVVAKESGDFTYRESQFEEILDALQIRVKFTFLDGAPWFSERFALLLFGSQRFFIPLRLLRYGTVENKLQCKET